MPATTRIEKLGINKKMIISFISPPDGIHEILGDLPEGTLIKKIGQPLMLDYIHGFYSRVRDLERDIHFLKGHLKKNGMIWISWPKGKLGKQTDLSRENVRTLGLGAGLVDIKVCSINVIWSAIKFVFR